MTWAISRRTCSKVKQSEAYASHTKVFCPAFFQKSGRGPGRRPGGGWGGTPAVPWSDQKGQAAVEVVDLHLGAAGIELPVQGPGQVLGGLNGQGVDVAEDDPAAGEVLEQ